MKIQRLRGPELVPYLDQLGALRIKVFRAFPYLYDGNLDYERQYLKVYIDHQESHITLVYDGQELVGATTAILAEHEIDAFKVPFEKAGYDPREICYFGESILLEKYRGQGLGKIFMEDRLKFASSFPKLKWASFCAVQRANNHPLRPKDYRPLDEFWKTLGFKIVPGLTTTYKWQDIGDQGESEKVLQFWFKPLI